jgi:hypothetical protein
MNDTDIAWSAGFFEGEGHVKAAKRRNDIWFAAEVAQVYRDPLDKLAKLFGGKVYGPYGPYKTNKKPYFMYINYGQTGISMVKLMRPYLFHKGEQVDAVLLELERRISEREESKSKTFIC